MKNIQEVFNRILESKKEHKSLRAMYKDALENSKEYRDLLEKLKDLKAKKKEIEDSTKADLGRDWDRHEILKLDIQHDKEMLSDLALSHVAKGEPVKVVDHEQKELEPIFSVRFRKQNTSNS
jgi:hypothetical protein